MVRRRVGLERAQLRRRELHEVLLADRVLLEHLLRPPLARRAAIGYGIHDRIPGTIPGAGRRHRASANVRGRTLSVAAVVLRLVCHMSLGSTAVSCEMCGCIMCGACFDADEEQLMIIGRHENQTRMRRARPWKAGAPTHRPAVEELCNCSHRNQPMNQLIGPTPTV